MIPVKFDQSNFTFTRPEGMTEEECGDLPVHRGQAPDGVPVIISCWEVTEKDIEEMKKTGRVWLSIAGNGMPPVSIFSDNPFQPGHVQVNRKP